MAFVVRIDTWETIGYFAGLNEPLPDVRQCCLFDAWRHPDGALRDEPPALPSAAAGPLDGPSPVKLTIPVHDPAAADLELMVSPSYLDFITHHPAFHSFLPRPWRRNGWRLLTATIRLTSINPLRSRQMRPPAV